MRISVIYLGRRGSGGLISLNLAIHLAKKADVFAVLSADAESLPAWRDVNIPHTVVRTYRTAFGAVWAWVNRRQVSQIAQLIVDRQPEVVIFPMFYTLNPLLQKYLAKIPSLVAVHDPIPHPGLTGKIYKVLEDLSIRQAERCLIFSRAFIETMNQRGIPTEHLVVIPHGEVNYLPQQVRKKVIADQKSKKRFTILFFGRITPYKGLEVLLDAYQINRQDLPIDLLIVGSGNMRPYRSRLRSSEGIQVINRWIPESEVGEYFAHADLVVLPYISATQSGVIPLAASYALPVIATQVGGIPEQIEDGRTGLLVEPGSVNGLARAIRELATQPGYAKKLGSALQLKYKNEFSWEKTADKIISVCEEVINR